MIVFDDTTKNAYKDFNREIQVYGNLYLANKRKSNNLFNDVVTNTWELTTTRYGYDASFLVEGKTYTIYSSTYPIACEVSYNPQGYQDFYKTMTGPTTITYTKDTHSSNPRYFYFMNSGSSVGTMNLQDSNVKIMVAESSTLKEYEPYGEYVIDYNTTGTNSVNIFNGKKILENYIYGDNMYKFTKTNSYYNDIPKVSISDLNMQVGNSYYLSLNVIQNAENKDEKTTLIFWNNDTYISEVSSTSSKLGIQKISFTVPQNTNKITLRLNRSTEQETNTIIVCDMQITQGTTYIPFERFNSKPFKLTGENQCQILSFYTNQKADIYYTSLPYNTMTIEVDNEKGYFTDFDEDSILDYLNENCYVDLFMKINNNSYYKIMSMNFDKISYTDYTRANLSFCSNIIKLEDYNILDNGNDMGNYLGLSGDDFPHYMYKSYNINTYFTNVTFRPIAFALYTTFKYDNLKDVIIFTGTNFGLTKQGAIITNDYQNALKFCGFTNIISETILKDYEIEKPTQRKENIYKNIKYNYYDDRTYTQTTETFTKQIKGVLNSKEEILIYTNADYGLNNITTSDITYTGLSSLSILNPTSSYNAKKLKITGNVGDEYTITFNKSNVYRPTSNTIYEYIYGDKKEITKFLKITEGTPIVNNTYTFLYKKKPVLSYVEVKIMALPYLEIGDTINIEIDNRNIRIVITEIETDFKDGLTQNIKGYELDWTYQQSDTHYNDLNDWT